MFLFGYIYHWALGQRPSTAVQGFGKRSYAGPKEKLVTGYGAWA